MKAMILAAGFGKRLRPHTNDIPKALVPFRSKPMINYQIERIKNLNVNEIIINSHHQSDLLKDYFQKNDFGIKTNLIIEDEILGTGGGILHAEEFLKSEEFFVVINVDVITDMNLYEMIDFHKKKKPFVTLAIQKRKTSRLLEFNERRWLIGKEHESSIRENLYAFNGIHIISNRIFEKNYAIKFRGILEIYFELIKKKEEIILGFDAGKCMFKDIGKIENLE
jgi:NDP-sugar pyrophosphorylase family protein